MGEKEEEVWFCPGCLGRELPFVDDSLKCGDSCLSSASTIAELTFDTSYLHYSMDHVANKELPSSSPSIHCGCINARSIVNKKLDLAAMLEESQLHVLAITETFLDTDILDSELNLNSHSIFRRDRSRKGGGVMLLVHNSISATRRDDLETDCEALWTELRIQSSSILL